MAKNHLILPAQYANDQAACQRDREQRMPSIAKIYAAYQTRLFQANAMDFDDLLVNTFLLLRDHPETRRKYASLQRRAGQHRATALGGPPARLCRRR